MGHVRHLVGGHDGVDDRRAIDGEGLGDCGHQLVRLSRHESVTATGACQRGKIGIGKFDGFAEWHEADAFGLQRDQPERGIIVDDDLDRQVVMNGGQEFSHQHVEAAVAGQGDHLARTVQRLHAVGLTERRAHRGIVERTDDALRSGLPDPVPRP